MPHQHPPHQNDDACHQSGVLCNSLVQFSNVMMNIINNLCCSVVHCDGVMMHVISRVCCSVLQCVAVCCSVLQE